VAQFTKGELDVMRILWAQGEMKPAEIQQKFPRDIRNSALRSYLTILLEKGHLTRRKVGKAFYYRPKTRRDSAFRNTLRSFLDTFCEGSAEGLLVRLIKSEELSEKELLELKRIADEVEIKPEQGRGRDEK
jgi:BlaI family penicillinase repressor